MDSISFDFLTQSADIRVRKLLGRSYLRENRLSEAAEIYLGILRDFPDDTDVLVILANLYRASGCPATAEHLYSRVLESVPENQFLKKLIAEVHEEAGNGAEEVLPLTAEAVERMVARLEALQLQDDSGEKAEEIRGTADMLERMIAEARQSDAAVQPNGQVKEDLQQLMPALLELNIRQARAAGRPELAEALQSLQMHMTRQVVNGK